MKALLYPFALLFALAFLPQTAQASGNCYETQRFYQNGYSVYRHGRRVWVPGQWVTRQVAVPCPRPVRRTPPRRPPVHRPPAPRPGEVCPAPRPIEQRPIRGERPGRLAMAPAHFQNVIARMQQARFEDRKVQIARRAARNNFLNANQVRRMMLQLDFERDRLHLAKIAFASCVTPNRYHIVEEALTFRRSIRELRAFISQSRRY